MKTVVFEAEVSLFKLLGRWEIEQEMIRPVIQDLEGLSGDQFRIAPSPYSRESLLAEWATELDFLPGEKDKILYSELDSIYERFFHANSEILNNAFQGRGRLSKDINVTSELVEDILEGFVVTRVIFEPFYFNGKTRKLLPHINCSSILEIEVSPTDEPETQKGKGPLETFLKSSAYKFFQAHPDTPTRLRGNHSYASEQIKKRFEDMSVQVFLNSNSSALARAIRNLGAGSVDKGKVLIKQKVNEIESKHMGG